VPVPTYTVSAPASVNEGNSVTFTITTTNVEAGSTFGYNLSGISAADLASGSLTGTVTIDAVGQAFVTVALKADNLTEGAETLRLTVATAHADVTVNDTSVELPQTLVLTPGADVLTGGSLGDTFVATQSTLQLGDNLNGGGGNDTLSVSISGTSAGITLDGFATTSIETISVKSLSSSASTLDLSDTAGVTRLVSMETDGAALTFRDIQSVNDTDITIIDTQEDHTFSYDLNAYAPGAGNDTIDLTLQELRDADNNDDNGNGPVITFNNRDGSRSNVDNVDLHSLSRAEAGPTAATTNFVNDLNVGRNLDTLTIDGNASLEIDQALDERVRVINAGALAANLTLDVVTETNVGTFLYTGAQGNDNLDVFRDGDNVINLNTGNDDLNVYGNGNLTITAGQGNDIVNIVGGEDNTHDGRHNISLNEGNDSLTITGDVNFYDVPNAINGGVTTIDAGTGNDVVTINGNGQYTVDLGADNDTLTKTGTGNNTVHAGAGNDVVSINAGSGSTSNFVYLEAGNDRLDITGNGNQFIVSDAGNDTVNVMGDGNHTITGDQGADRITITGDGVHNINLGTEDDYLLIDGARVADGNIDNTPNEAMTTIVAGSGNDTVDVREDHWLNADLGSGDDLLILRAKDLTTDDVVAGGTGRDTLRLTNGNYAPVLVDQSETGSTTGIEVFDLRNANITLELTADNFDTAEGKFVTVSTRDADRTILPEDLVALGLHQGMTVADFTVLAQAVYPSLSAQGAREALVYDLLHYYGVQGVDFNDQTADGDNQVFTAGDSISVPTEIASGTNPSLFNVNDKVFFLVEPDGYQAVDITAVPLSLASGRTFKLEGGNIQDIVIADADSINGRSTLEFDGPGGVNQSVTDTLRVIGGADITAADLRNVSGLEVIELRSGSNQPARWDIELNSTVINQTTGSADLVIDVSDEVAAGSKLYITLDSSVHGASTNNVQIVRNANISVYITDAANGLLNHLVTEDEFGQDFDTGLYTITVVNQLEFTTNTDNLVGTGGDDTFVARSLDQLQSADNANGAGGEDTVELNFAVANSDEALSDQLNYVGLSSVESLVFNTENQVSFDTIDYKDNWWATSLESIETGSASDSLTNIERDDMFFRLNNGNDYISFDGSYSERSLHETIDGGEGSDTVVGGGEYDYFTLGDVEFVNGNGGNDTFIYDLALGGNHGDIYVDGGSGEDSLQLDSNGTDGVAYVTTVETIRGGNGVDHIDASNNSGSGSLYVFGGSSNDTISVHDTSYAHVDGDNGFDDITVVATYVTVNGGNNADVIRVGNGITIPGGGSGVYDALVNGDNGNDNITVNADHDANVSGGDGADTILVNANHDAIVNGGLDDDNITVNAFFAATVSGGDGNDLMNLNIWDAASVSGGNGNDTINLHFGLDTALADTSTVDAGAGNDIITVNSNPLSGGLNDNHVTIIGGEGNDVIHLTDSASGSAGIDTIVFGDVTYNLLQQATNTNGYDTIDHFNFELGGPGAQDRFNFNAFLGAGPHNVVALTAAASELGAGNDVGVLAAANNFVLTSAAVAAMGDIADEGKKVIIVAKDGNGTLGYDTFDVYYVQDIDQDVGQAWAVDLVATVHSSTEIGSISAINNVHIVQ
jgi:hypothetical protein